MTSCWNQIIFRTLPGYVLLDLIFAIPLYAQDAIPLDSLLFEAHSLHENIPSISAPAAAADTLSALSTFPAARQTAAESTICLYLNSIAATESASGPFAPALLEQYLSLGETYQQNAEHTEAIAILEKAEYIARINSGLFAAEQFVIVENLVASYIATGEWQKAAEKQQYLLFLNRQNFGARSLQAVPVLHKLGDWQMAAFSSLINADNVTIISFGRQPSARELAFNSLYLAQDTYYEAILNLVTNNQLSNPVLPELELNLIETIFLAANREGVLHNPDFYMDRRPLRTGSRVVRRDLSDFSLSFANGRNAYARLRAYEERQPQVDPLAVARTIIGLGDWHLLFSHAAAALRIYEEADAYLRSHNVAEDVITNLLSPEIPQQLPLFTPLPHSRKKYAIDADRPLEFAGYADVSFELSRFGTVHNLKLTGTRGNFTKDMQRRLRRIMQSSPFRPRLQQGKASASAVNMRYYFTDIRTIRGARQM